MDEVNFLTGVINNGKRLSSRPDLPRSPIVIERMISISKTRPVRCTGSLPTRPTNLCELDTVSNQETVVSAEALSGIRTLTKTSLPVSVPNYGIKGVPSRVKPTCDPHASDSIPNIFSHLRTSTPCTAYLDAVERQPFLHRPASDLLVYCLISSLRSARMSVSEHLSEEAPKASDQPSVKGPRDQRSLSDPEKRVTPTWVAGWNVVNLIQGIGILGIPYACICAGWASLPIIIGVAVLCCFTGKLLVETMYRYPEEPCEE